MLVAMKAKGTIHLVQLQGVHHSNAYECARVALNLTYDDIRAWEVVEFNEKGIGKLFPTFLIRHLGDPTTMPETPKSTDTQTPEPSAPRRSVSEVFYRGALLGVLLTAYITGVVWMVTGIIQRSH